jgi:pimeloyl-ACP methyl ester carboxylesterase
MTALSQQERSEVRSADGTLIPVYKSGSGPPLLMVHGGGGNHANWDRVRPYLETHHTVWAVDRRNSFVDPNVRYDLEREFEDVAAIARQIGGELDLLGSSSGGLCALGASLLVPGVRRLVLYEPPYVAGKPTDPEFERLVTSGELEAAAEYAQLTLMKLSPDLLAANKAAPGWPTYVERIPYFLREEAVVQAWQPDVEALKVLKAPILFLVGEKSPAGHQHRGYIDILTAAGLNLTVVEIPGQEHFAHNQTPELFSQLVLDFLEAN